MSHLDHLEAMGCKACLRGPNLALIGASDEAKAYAKANKPAIVAELKTSLLSGIRKMRDWATSIDLDESRKPYALKLAEIARQLEVAMSRSVEEFEEARKEQYDLVLAIVGVLGGSDQVLEGDALAASMKDVIGERERTQAAIPELDLGAFAPAPPEQQLLSGV